MQYCTRIQVGDTSTWPWLKLCQVDGSLEDWCLSAFPDLHRKLRHTLVLDIPSQLLHCNARPPSVKWEGILQHTPNCTALVLTSSCIPPILQWGIPWALLCHHGRPLNWQVQLWKSWLKKCWATISDACWIWNVVHRTSAAILGYIPVL